VNPFSAIGTRIGTFLEDHPRLKAFIQKVMKDNIGVLASLVSWALLTSLIPILAGLVAISGLLLRNPSAQRAVVDHLSLALQGVLSPQELSDAVKAAVRHRGLLGVIGFFGILWGGSNIGGAVSTAFQPVFQVRGRSIVHQKAIDFGMILVFTVLMLIIVAATTATSLITRVYANFPLSSTLTLVIATVVSFTAAFILFAVVYTIFPNVETRFKLRNVWPGAIVAAVLLQSLTFVWPIYAHLARFSRYGAVLFPLVVLTAWIYFFSMILLLGAEIVAFRAMAQAARAGERQGPAPDGTVPQREDRP